MYSLRDAPPATDDEKRKLTVLENKLTKMRDSRLTFLPVHFFDTYLIRLRGVAPEGEEAATKGFLQEFLAAQDPS